MPSFEIPDGPATVPVKVGTANGQPARVGQATYSVTNKSSTVLSGRLSVQVAGDAKAEWFTVQGEKERSFNPGETQTINVDIAIPATVKPGTYKFRPRVVAVNNTDGDATDGPVGTVQLVGAPAPVGPKPTPKPFPAWIIAVIVAAVVLVGGGITAAVLLLNKGPKMPVVAHMTVDEATKTLADLKLDLKVTTQPQPKEGEALGTVFDQKPAAKAKLKKGDAVVLFVASAPPTQLVEVPDVTGKDYRTAQGLLEARGLTAQPVQADKAQSPPDQVWAQDPAPGQKIPGGQAVKVSYDPGVKMPDFSSGTMTVAQAVSSSSGRILIANASLQCQQGAVAGEDITGQSVPAGQTVARLTPVNLTVVRTVTGLCWKPYLTVKAVDLLSKFKLNQ